jgi:hypothetical protein
VAPICQEKGYSKKSPPWSEKCGLGVSPSGAPFQERGARWRSLSVRVASRWRSLSQRREGIRAGWVDLRSPLTLYPLPSTLYPLPSTLYLTPQTPANTSTVPVGHENNLSIYRL